MWSSIVRNARDQNERLSNGDCSDEANSGCDDDDGDGGDADDSGCGHNDCVGDRGCSGHG